ncbi:hypothetical protein BDR22DRAFT_822531 [Usnea florida]
MSKSRNLWSYQCEWDGCEKSFKSISAFESHYRRHTDQPFSCTYEGCNNNFCASEGLMQHEKSHTARSLHPCEHQSCGQIFTKLSELQRHYCEEHVKPQSVDMARPIRLRLSQPKRQNPESIEGAPRRLLVLRPPKMTLKSPSNSNSTEGDENGSESKKTIKLPDTHAERKDVKFNARPPRSSYNNGPHADGHSSGQGSYWYTKVCGVYSKEKSSPKKIKTSGGSHHCPRCDTQFTRPQSVRRHFVGCIAKNGNPDSLRWTDHPSLQRTVKIYAHKENLMQEDGNSPQGVDLRRNEKESHELSKHASLHYLAPDSRTSVIEENEGSVEPVSTGHVALLQDALRRSKYNPETISMKPLNAHLDILRENFKFASCESNMSTFRWDLVDPEQEPERRPEEPPQQEVRPRPSTPDHSKADGNALKSRHKDIQWLYGSRSFLPSRSLIESSVVYTDPSVRVFSPGMTHFGPMSTLFSNAFDGDPFARLMSSNGELWAAIFTMLEHHYPEQNFEVRAAVRISDGELVGWVACHEVDTLQAADTSRYLDWVTAAHLLPSQISRFSATRESAKEKAERSSQKTDCQAIASTIQARATEAQILVVPIRRLVINALVVHPLHQGRGVASALLKSIIAIADTRKIPIWIQAPEAPAVAQGVVKTGLFRRAGFMCAAELNENLVPDASKSQKPDGEKGAPLPAYKWNYMLRWPW